MYFHVFLIREFVLFIIQQTAYLFYGVEARLDVGDVVEQVADAGLGALELLEQLRVGVALVGVALVYSFRLFVFLVRSFLLYDYGFLFLVLFSCYYISHRCKP